MLSERLWTTLYKKTLSNLALILLGQHYTCQNSMECCLKGSRQYCIRKNPVQCWFNTIATTFHSWKLYVILPKRLQRQHCIRKNSVQCCLNTLEIILHRSKSYEILSERLQTTLHKKKSCLMLSWYPWVNIAQLKTLCNVVWEAPDNTA